MELYRDKILATLEERNNVEIPARLFRSTAKLHLLTESQTLRVSYRVIEFHCRNER